MVRYLDPSNWLALEVRSSDDKIRLLRRQDDGAMSTVYTSVSGSGMSDGNWCQGEIVIGGSGVVAGKLGIAAVCVFGESGVSARRRPAYITWITLRELFGEFEPSAWTDLPDSETEFDAVMSVIWNSSPTKGK